MKNAQKTLFKTAFIYLVIGMLSGVLYREVTKFKEFPVDNATQLSTLHTHLLVLGFIVPLVVLALDKLYTLAGSKQFTWFFYLYNIGLVITLVMMTVRGWLQVMAGSPLEQTPELSKGHECRDLRHGGYRPHPAGRVPGAADGAPGCAHQHGAGAGEAGERLNADCGRGHPGAHGGPRWQPDGSCSPAVAQAPIVVLGTWRR